MQGNDLDTPTILLKSHADWGDALDMKPVLRYTTLSFRHPAVFLRIRIEGVWE